mmetsp:Transcript_54071/g.131254  ORF Transcript_54071/g.131254 Transcript_54071/m.131254 type:complete len:93 (-) Transcript_54071:679-957(-)
MTPPSINNDIPPASRYDGYKYNPRIAPIHPRLTYAVVVIHFGVFSNKCATMHILMMANVQTTEKNDHPITDEWRNTRHKGVKVPAISGKIAK